jgi:hypothetical protein
VRPAPGPIRALALCAAVLLVTGCSRVDTLRLAHANSGTPVDWPAGATVVSLLLEPDPDGRPWLPISVDGSAPLPFLLQASAGAIALTGARPAGPVPVTAGRLVLREGLLPGIGGGQLVKQRRLALDALQLGDQSLLLVELEHWPHGRPGGGAAGVLGYDLLRRFVLEFDLAGGRLALHRPGSFDFARLAETQRLAVLDRRPYFEAWLEIDGASGRWLRMQFEPAAPVGACLDAGGRGMVRIAGRAIRVAPQPCAAAEAPGSAGTRDGVMGGVALLEFTVVVDYEGRRIGFQPHR